MNNYLDIHETAALIHRTPGAVRNLVMRKRIPFRKPAGRLMFLEAEIRAWVEDTEGGLSYDELKKRDA